MNDIKIGTYNMQDFGLYLPEYTIPSPTPQTKFIDIIGRDGPVDLSNALGDIHFGARKWTLNFKCFDPTINWHTLTTNVMNAIHGKRLNFEFADDPNYFWTGRFNVVNYTPRNGEGTIRVDITSDPFKYTKLATIVQETVPKTTTYSGSVASFTATADNVITSLTTAITPVQDLHGYANPWPAGGGKNLLDVSQSEAGGIDASGSEISTAGNWRSTNYIPVTANASYTMSITGILAGRLRLYFYDSGNTFISPRTQGDYGVTSVTGTAPATAAYMRWVIYQDGGITQAQVEAFKPMIELGSTATAWEPYSNICPITGYTGANIYVSPTQNQADATTYTFTWSGSAGTVYGGSPDVVTGVLTVDRAKVTLDSNLSQSDITITTYNDFTRVSYTPYAGVGKPLAGFVCDTLSDNLAQEGLYKIWHSADPTAARMFLGVPSTVTTKAEAVAWFTANPTTVVYELYTPVEYTLTPQQVAALVGQNYIWADTGDVSVDLSEPILLTNNGRKPVVPTVTASAQMTLRWDNYTYTMNAGTAVIPQLVLDQGTTKVFVDGTGTIKFEYSEASL